MNHVRVGVGHVPLLSELVRSPSGLSMRGFMRTVVDHLISSAKLKYTLVEVEGKATWENRLKLLQGGKADILIYPTTLTYSRNLEANFLNPAWYSRNVLFSGYPKLVSNTVFSNLLVCDWQVGSSLLLSLLVLAAVFSEAQKLGSKYRYDMKTWTSYLTFRSIWFRALWNFTGNLFSEPFPKIPRSGIVRFMCATWFVALFFLSAQLGGHMKSEFSSTEHLKVETVEHLLQYDHIRPLVAKGTGVEEFFMHAPVSQAREVWKKIVKLNGSLPNDVFYDKKTYDNVFEGRGVMVNDYDRLIMQFSALEDHNHVKSLYLGSEIVFWKMSAYTVSSNFTEAYSVPILRTINLRMRDFFEFSLWKFHTLPIWYRFESFWFDPIEEVKALNASQLLGVFYIWLTGLGVSTACLLLEKAIKIFQWN